MNAPDLRGKIAVTLDEQIGMIERKRDKAKSRVENAKTYIDLACAHASLESYRNILESLEDLRTRRAG